MIILNGAVRPVTITNSSITAQKAIDCGFIGSDLIIFLTLLAAFLLC